MIVFLGVVIVLIVSQNFVAVGLAKLLGVDALVGLCTGSIPMVGGHGTAGAFGPVLEDFGIQGPPPPVYGSGHLWPDRGQHDGRPHR